MWLDREWEPLETYKALRSWVNMLSKANVGARQQGQIWETIDVGGELVVDGERVPAHPERVLMYLAKHAARGVAHYQRQIENMPDDWQYRSGRVWGHDRGLPLRELQDVECDYPPFWRYRRLVRRWRCGEAQAIVDPSRRRAASSQARGMLKGSRPGISPYRGISAWLPADVASQLFTAAVRGGEHAKE